ncbi:ExbD/TolR family protein [Phaeodactylibacter luteus]|uniref:Biopolymer transporter ExbD n=1 Tax=Phaeodactylibacter luteus TaxID=1564516 RepID=A0A5C6RG77_9BACT|nr:biopolymer transporter ExbD [Phaeodactylibacter luteus]TXB61271.1 biopolymer transporter ExbD [Phaeodactylibacter luteus]
MGLKKRSKVSAEFSMSSLTDIIFLLLIFFMLTSTLVRIQPFELPKSDSKTVASTSIVVTLEKNGRSTVNNQEVSGRDVERALRSEVGAMGNRENAAITIVAEIGTPFDRVVEIMEMANRLKVSAIIATEPRS